MERSDGGRRAPPGKREQLRDAVALSRLGSKARPPVPWLYAIRNIARSWGVPPWVVAGETPDEDTVARWLIREQLFLSMEG